MHDEEDCTSEAAVRQRFAASYPLVSQRLPFSSPQVSQHFGNFQLTSIAGESVRIVRPDGSCFYRAYCYRILELVSAGVLAESAVLEKFTNLNSTLVSRFYPTDLISDFFEAFTDLLHAAASSPAFSVDTITQDDSMYMITFFRCLTGAALRADSLAFQAFMTSDEYPDIDAFCRAEVDAVNRECDMLQITALTACTHISVDIYYLDLHSPPSRVLIPHSPTSPASPAAVTLLYKPGHYDLLYTR